MDFLKNVVLKENYTFLVADETGSVHLGEKGVYDRDTRFLSRYEWDVDENFQTLVAHTPRPDTFVAHYAEIDGPQQLVGVQRTLLLGGACLKDHLRIENTSLEVQEFSLRLHVHADFTDLFAARGWFDSFADSAAGRPGDGELTFRHVASDGVEQAVRLRFDADEVRVDENGADFPLRLEPKAVVEIGVEVELENPIDEERTPIPYDAWRGSFAELTSVATSSAVGQAVDDLRSLLLLTESGPVPAAGVPWFVAAFGRDALLTAHLLLPYRTDVAEGTLRYLAGAQAIEPDVFRAAQPGKILHEMRYGEFARTGITPHAPYYGTVDATPLFVTLLEAHARHAGSFELVRELRPNWEAALAWIVGPGDPDSDGFLEFESTPQEAGTGLTIQSWKDSSDSMSHADGRLAGGAIAVSEVQGYAYAAYRAAAWFYERLGEAEHAHDWEARAEHLKRTFDTRFWLDELGTYAMALDGEKRPLQVKNSDAGQLLWTGIVREERADRLVATLFDDASYSGWGFRTLGSGEVRFNPVSYHNGSVWPHDSALIIAGLERYGYVAEARRAARAILDLADAQPDRRLPELVAGYPRTEAPPVPYPVACRPQAWDAAAVVHLARLLASVD